MAKAHSSKRRLGLIHTPPNLNRLRVKKTISRDVSSEADELRRKLYVFIKDGGNSAKTHNRPGPASEMQRPASKRLVRAHAEDWNADQTSDRGHISKNNLSDISRVPSSAITTDDSTTANGSSLRSSGMDMHRDGKATPLQSQTARPKVQDPVEQAISRLVKRFGFSKDDAKWALEATDIGEGINVNVKAAEQLLTHEESLSIARSRLEARTTL